MTLPTTFAAALGMPELIIILVILLVLFGGSKLPSLAKGLGQSMKEFKRATKDDDDTSPPASPAAVKSVSEIKKPETAARPGTN